MHNLALALSQKGYQVTGSDDQIFEPSRSRLKAAGILPEEDGWFPEKIHENLDGVILGMHARAGNPELEKAKELGLPIYSYPEFLYHAAKDKTRVVIGGSHGKTSITAMLLHVLNAQNLDFDYMVGAQLDGFHTMVKISDAPIMVLEGDEYLSSPLDPRPKFHWYQPHHAVISGIAWDHINVFPTFDNYLEQFRIFARSVKQSLFYAASDQHLNEMIPALDLSAQAKPYQAPDHRIEDGKTIITHQGKAYTLEIFGEHNLYNLNAAMYLAQQLGVESEEFYTAISSFTGASRRLEKIVEKEGFTAFKDFAHSPSKVKATVKAVRDQFPNRKLYALLELHTFSSLTADFLKEYEGAMQGPEKAMVYYNPATIAHKKLEAISVDQVKEAFQQETLEVYTDSTLAMETLSKQSMGNAVVLIMSSGNFDGKDIDAFLKSLV